MAWFIVFAVVLMVLIFLCAYNIGQTKMKRKYVKALEKARDDEKLQTFLSFKDFDIKLMGNDDYIGSIICLVLSFFYVGILLFAIGFEQYHKFINNTIDDYKNGHFVMKNIYRETYSYDNDSTYIAREIISHKYKRDK